PVPGSPELEAAHAKRCDRVEELLPELGRRTRERSRRRHPFPLRDELLQLVNQSFQQRRRNSVLVRWQILLGRESLEKCDGSCATDDEDHRPDLVAREDRRSLRCWRLKAVGTDLDRSSSAVADNRTDHQGIPPTAWRTGRRALRNPQRKVQTVAALSG